MEGQLLARGTTVGAALEMARREARARKVFAIEGIVNVGMKSVIRVND